MNTGSPDRPRPSLESLLQEIAALEQAVAGWEESQQRTVDTLRRAVDDLHGEALRRLIRILQGEPHARVLLREAAGDEVVYAVLRRLGVLRASLDERVEEALTSVRPMLAQHGGDVELVGITPPDTVTIRLLGACDGCPASSITLSQGVEQAIQAACPEITQVQIASAPVVTTPVQTVRMVSPFEQAECWFALDVDPDTGPTLQACRVNGQDLLLVRTGDGPRCFENACAHLGLGMEDGECDGAQLTCPHHGFRYETGEGRCLSVPELGLRRFPLRTRDGVLQVYLA